MTDIDDAAQHDAWNGDSGQRWASDADRRDRVLAPVADVLHSAAALQLPERVLDIGCGCGATTLAAAHSVGPDGAVAGIDVSQVMLDVARRRQRTAGITNLRFIHGDAQTDALPGPFDVAISRFGTMFFADAAAAFANIASALRPGGRLCLSTWQPLSANAWITVPGAALLRYGTMPAAGDGATGMFAQSEPDAVTRVLADAGFVDVDVAPVRIDLPLGADPDDAVDYLAGSGIGRAVLATVPDRDKAAALDAVRAVLTDHADDVGVHLPAAIWIITATRGSGQRRVHGNPPGAAVALRSGGEALDGRGQGSCSVGGGPGRLPG